MTSVYFEDNPGSEKVMLEDGGFKIINYLNDEGDDDYSNSTKYFADLAHITTYDHQGNRINEEIIDNPNLQWLDEVFDEED